MADFCITAVRYNDNRDHITKVVVREEMSTSIGQERVVDRAFIADLIRLGKATFITRTKNSEGKWTKGADVHTLEDVYLTTQKNTVKRDNLGNLPEF